MDIIDSKHYITKINKRYKNNIKQIAKKNKNFTLKELSQNLGYSDNYISHMCNKNTSILNNTLLHTTSIALNCTLT